MNFKLSNLWKRASNARAAEDAPPPQATSREPAAERQSIVASSPSSALEEQAVEMSVPPHPPADQSAGAEAEVNIGALLKIKLPPLPNAALHVAKLSQSLTSSTHVIADAIGYDPVLAARILRAANSSLFSRERRVTALTAAVSALGGRNIHQLAISYATSSFFEAGPPSLIERTIWKHSVFVALAARQISLDSGLHGSEEAFLCGLLHDIGKVLLLRHDAKPYARLVEITNEREMLAGERETYGFTHARVSALVAEHWGLAPEINHAILYHHDPDAAHEAILLTRVLSAANKLANASGFGFNQLDHSELLEDETIFLLELSAERLDEIRERAEESMNEMMHVLSK